jgi:hypothetical protein
VDPATTCVLANEVSDHLRIYMWGRVARTFLALPEEDFAVATSCHADTVDDVLDMLLRDLRLPVAAAQKLGIIANIGLVGRVWPPRRRFLTVNFVAPAGASTKAAPGAGGGASPGTRGAGAAASGASHSGLRLLSLARWDARTDTQVPVTPAVLGELAGILGLPPAELAAAVERRRACLELLAQDGKGRGVGLRAFREAVETLASAEMRAASAETAASDTSESSESGGIEEAGEDSAPA